MNRSKSTVLMTGALTAALVLGGIGYAYGETVDDASTEIRRLGGAMHRAGGGLAGIVADLTGLDIGDVMDRRADGESFAVIAESEGVETDDVKDVVVSGFEEQLDERMSSTDPMVRGERPGGMMGGPRGETPESVLADLSGLELDEIRDMRTDGESLAEIAADLGVDIDSVIDTVIASAEEGMQTLVDDGRMDADQVADRLENLRTQLEEIVDSTDVPPLGGMGGHRGGHGNPGTAQ